MPVQLCLAEQLNPELSRLREPQPVAACTWDGRYVVVCELPSSLESNRCFGAPRNSNCVEDAADTTEMQSNGAGLVLQTGLKTCGYPNAGAVGVLPPNTCAVDVKDIQVVPAVSNGMADSRPSGDHDQGGQQMSSKNGPESDKPKRTLLVAYLPRCAAEHDLEQAFVLAGISGNLSVHVVREEGTSKCFGFVRFPTRDLARAVYEACQDGKIVIQDGDGKPWHIKASWARTELRNLKQHETTKSKVAGTQSKTRLIIL